MKQKGFTLVELLLYTALIGMVVLTAAVLLSVMQKQKIRDQVIREVEEQGLASMQVMTQTIRNSTLINSPAASASAGILSINVPTAGLSPTTFGLSSGSITMTEGSNPAVNLTSGKVVVSGMNFANLSRGGSFGTIRIQYTVSYNNPGGIADFNYSKLFTGSASLR